MSSARLPAAIKNKAIAAVAIVSVFVLLYVLTSGNNDKQLITKKDVVDTSKCDTALITVQQVAEHNKCSLTNYQSNDFWIIVDDHVYDVTDWILKHPGGEALCTVDTKSSSKYFHQSHGDPKGLIEQILKPTYCIGKFGGAADS